MDQLNDNLQDMDTHHTSFIAVIIGNIKFLLVFLFSPVINYMITILPEWKDSLENFKLIGGSVIVVLVITKLILEIIKLIKK